MINERILINYSKVYGLFIDSKQIGFEYFKLTVDFQFENGEMTNNTELNNKLIKEHYDGVISAEEAMNLMETNLVEKFKKEKSIQWEKVVSLLGRNNVFNIFYKMKDQLSNEDYWMVLSFCYTTSSFAYSNSELQLDLFFSERPNREFLMNEEDRKFFYTLPDELTIYRGCSIEEIETEDFRMSWTLNEEVAKFFAYEYKTSQNIECSVISLRVNKTSIIAYLNDRNEEEVLYIQDLEFINLFDISTN